MQIWRLGWRAGMIVTLAVSVLMASASSPASAANKLPNVQYAKQQIAKYEKIPPWVSPGPSLNVKALAGKTILDVTYTTAVAYVVNIDQGMANIAKQFRINFILDENQGDPVQWVAGINQGIQEKVAAIILSGVPPALVAPQIMAARTAGIPVIAADNYDPADTNLPSFVSAFTYSPYYVSARLEADAAIAKRGTTPIHALIVTSSVLGPTAINMVASLKGELSKVCGSTCSIADTLDIPPTQWGTNITPAVESALVSHPDINWVFSIFAAEALFVAPALLAVNKTSTVPISTYNGDLASLDLVYKGDIYSEASANAIWVAYTNMDQIFRVMLGKPVSPPNKETSPIRTIDASNVHNIFHTVPSAYTDFGTAFKADYDRLWGLRSNG
jgi:ribose transport system substrate-binding protein